MLGNDLRAWQKWMIGKQCPKHPQSILRNARYGLWCGNKTEWGVGCDGGFPSDEDIIKMKQDLPKSEA